MEFNRIIPELSVSDLERSLRFYIDAIGFRIEYRREESKFAFVSFQGSQIMLEERNGHWETGRMEHPFGRGINFQIIIAEIAPIITELSYRKYPLMKAPWDSWYRKEDHEVGQRQFLVQDPDGYLLRFAESLGIRKAA
jgi:catechol 2,3-dioxygenase-like lactoylglutathione lyase family enzyme